MGDERTRRAYLAALTGAGGALAGCTTALFEDAGERTEEPGSPTRQAVDGDEVSSFSGLAPTPQEIHAVADGSERGWFVVRYPTPAVTGERVPLGIVVQEAPTEQYGAYRVFVNEHLVDAAGMRAGDSTAFLTAVEPASSGTAEARVEVRFTNEDTNTDELVGHVELTVPAVDDVARTLFEEPLDDIPVASRCGATAGEGEADTGGSGGEPGGDDGGDERSDPGEPWAEAPESKLEPQLHTGNFERGSYRIEAPKVSAVEGSVGSTISIEVQIHERRERYGAYVVEIDGQQVDKFALAAGEYSSAFGRFSRATTGEHEFNVVVRFTNSDFGTDTVLVSERITVEVYERL
jgi:hypothetical protein